MPRCIATHLSYFSKILRYNPLQPMFLTLRPNVIIEENINKRIPDVITFVQKRTRGSNVSAVA